MANDFMRNANKMVLDGEVVSFSDTFPIVEMKEVTTKTLIVEEPKKEEKIEETVVDVNDEEIVAKTEDGKITESDEEKADEE